jgi:hypothetical protein
MLPQDTRYTPVLRTSTIFATLVVSPFENNAGAIDADRAAKDSSANTIGIHCRIVSLCWCSRVASSADSFQRLNSVDSPDPAAASSARVSAPAEIGKGSVLPPYYLTVSTANPVGLATRESIATNNRYGEVRQC